MLWKYELPAEHAKTKQQQKKKNDNEQENDEEVVRWDDIWYDYTLEPKALCKVFLLSSLLSHALMSILWKLFFFTYLPPLL